METGVGSCAKETKLNELMQVIIDMSCNLQDSRNKLNNLSDRLLGNVPECTGNDSKTPERAGALGLFEDKIDQLKYNVHEMMSAVDRIANSDIA